MSLIVLVPSKVFQYVGDNTQYQAPPDQELNAVQGKTDSGAQGVTQSAKETQSSKQAAAKAASDQGGQAGTAAQNYRYGRGQNPGNQRNHN